MTIPPADFERLKADELMPCPFCGSKDIDPEGVASIAEEHRKEVGTWDKAQPHHIVNRPACTNCNATTDGDWNTRESLPASPQDGDRVAVLEAAIRWACGEGDSDFRQRKDGEGAYWWRKELRQRAALPYVAPPVPDGDALKALEALLYEAMRVHDTARESKYNADILRARLTSAVTWMPIDTAPRDGTLVMVYVKSKIGDTWIDVGRYTGGKHKWLSGSDVIYPTHWQPLPQPPKEGE